MSDHREQPAPPQAFKPKTLLSRRPPPFEEPAELRRERELLEQLREVRGAVSLSPLASFGFYEAVLIKPHNPDNADAVAATAETFKALPRAGHVVTSIDGDLVQICTEEFIMVGGDLGFMKYAAEQQGYASGARIVVFGRVP